MPVPYRALQCPAPPGPYLGPLHLLALTHLDMLWQAACHSLHEASYRSSPGLATTTVSWPLKSVPLRSHFHSTIGSHPRCLWLPLLHVASSLHSLDFYTRLSMLHALVGLSPPSRKHCEGQDSVYTLLHSGISAPCLQRTGKQ